MTDFDDIPQDDDDDMPTAPFWMTTFSDMATLLLTFFVLIVSMSEVEVKKFQEALSNFKGRSSVLEFESMVPSKSSKQSRNDAAQSQEEKDQRFEELVQYLKEHDLEDKVNVNLLGNGLHVSITDSVVFESGKADLKPSSLEVLKIISAVLGPSVQSLRVEGHTDDQPISTSTFPSNWELSAARAAAVVRYLLAQPHAPDAEEAQVVGFGEFHPIATNKTREGRARNRRVEILFSEEPWQKDADPISTRLPMTK